MSWNAPLNRTGALIYSLPWIGTAFVLTPLAMILPAFYAAHAGVSLAALGVATAVLRLLDAAVDPMVGHLSDRTRSRLGPRRPWVIAGTLMLCVSVWHLFQPHEGVGIGWYFGWAALLYAAQACIETPLRAWGAELSRDPGFRARLFTQAGVARALGSLGFWVTPLLALWLAGTGQLDDPHTLAVAAAVLVCGMPLLVGLTLLRTPTVPASHDGDVPPFREFLRDALANRPLACFVGAYGLWSASSGAASAVTFIYLGSYLGLGASLTLMLGVFFVVQIVAMPWWVKVLHRIEKHRLLALVWLIDAALKPLFFGFAPGPEPSLALWTLLILMAITGSVSYGIPMAVLADIVDLDTLRSKSSRPASFFALGTLLYKVCFGLGSSLALLTLAAWGFDLNLPLDGPVVAGMPIGLVWAVMIVPGGLLLAAAALMSLLRLDARRHDIVLRRLARRSAIASRNQG